ncbi:MAG: pilus assembly protein PilM [Candidatus Omnitrophota bacterium]|nr:pilus assembly protein PilM [Candidatus Omnitrophota bacterium]
MAMDLKNIFKKEYIIGLDIGSSSVKIAQFQSREDGLHLVKAELKDINYTDDGDAREKETLSALRHLLRGVDIKKSKIIVAINCPETAVKKVTAPYMPKSELRQGIILEAKSYFPFPIEDSFLDFEILGDIVEKGVRKYEVLVAVSPKKTAENYLSLLGKAGIKPSSFVPHPYVFQKLAGQFHFSARGGSAYGGKEDQVRYFLIIGRSNSELIVLKGDNLVFSRKIPVTGNDFTKAMTGVLVSDRGKTELSMEDAEKIKREIGIPREDESKIVDDKISTTQILSMLRSPLEQLVSEMQRCFDYYREEGGGGKVDSLILFGGGASLGGIIEFLSKELEIEVRPGDVLKDLKLDAGSVADKDKISYRLGLAVGAALTEGKGINLLPPEIKEETTRTIKRGTIEAVFTAIVVTSILLSIGMKIKIDNFNKRITTAKTEMASLGGQVKEAEAKMLVQTILSDEPYWEDVFHELGSLIRNEIRIENVRVENKVIRIKGIVDSADGQQALADFIIDLEKGIFNGVKLIESKNLPDYPGVEFEISCRIDYER